jgi:transcriptional regulator with XRE-family HTH domain
MVDAAGDFSWQEVGSRIREMRLARDISQAELARRAKLSAPGLFAIEKGAINPQLSSLRSIARVLGCSVRSLLTGEQQEPTEQVGHIVERVRRILESENINAINALLSGVDAGYLMLQTKAEMMEALYAMRFPARARARMKEGSGLSGSGHNVGSRSSKKRGQS